MDRPGWPSGIAPRPCGPPMWLMVPYMGHRAAFRGRPSPSRSAAPRPRGSRVGGWPRPNALSDAYLVLACRNRQARGRDRWLIITGCLPRCLRVPPALINLGGRPVRKCRSASVVPARAGIFPGGDHLRHLRGGRPRPRGDLPQVVLSAPASTSSSPPARGSSPSKRAMSATGPVVPARAGIFPPRRDADDDSVRRPRPRGDLPPADPISPRGSTSSPPARGSSLVRVSHGAATSVVPARAGIFPGRRRRTGKAVGRPRPRGDLPTVSVVAERFCLSSPPARGSSLGGEFRRGGHTVVPARAGIFPRTRHATCPRRSRPRPRGDLPSPPAETTPAYRSSPPARGSSARSRAARPDLVGRPRPRGDLPAPSSAASSAAWSSPPARGSSASLRRLGGRRAVVPARAGIFPRRSGRRRRGWGRPRPRGDLPGRRSSATWCGGSSPPARGSSSSVEVPCHAPFVVPARAGIFRRGPVSALGSPCRPRPRGDLPQPHGELSPACTSSPPARGSSRHPRLRERVNQVVPARAGIFPRPGRAGTPCRCRPRPRGDLPRPTLSFQPRATSSPPARGSSVVAEHQAVGGDVVPARAGIFRRHCPGRS